MRVPNLNAWDQFIWPPAAAMPRALMEVEQYGYHCGQAVDLRPVMPATQFRVTDKVGTYLCVVRALVFEGSILAYNPARDEAEWAPMRGLTNDLTWAEEKSTMALANYVPCVSQEVACIARLGACQLTSWPADSSTSEERTRNWRRKRNTRKEGNGKKWTPKRHLPTWSSSKVKQKKSPNQVGDDDHEIGG